jgi:hypothetical protein
MTSLPRIFVSHATEDTEFAERLAADLRARELDVWLDTSHLGPGDFVDRISRALNARDILILILSPAALNSHWVPDEMNAAIIRYKQGFMKPPIVVTVTAVPLQDIPGLWTAYGRIDATHNYDAALPHVLRAIAPSIATRPSPAIPQPEVPPTVPQPRQSRQDRPPRLLPPHLHRVPGSRRTLVFTLAAAVLAVALVVAIFSNGFLKAGPSVNTSATKTVNANASATTAAAITATVATALTVRFPYVALQPGSQCDSGVAPWQSDNSPDSGGAQSCAYGPPRTHLVLTCSSSHGCWTAIFLTTGVYFHLPSSYTVSVDVSGLSTNAGVDLFLSSSSPSNSGSPPLYQLWLYSNGHYFMCHATNQGGCARQDGQGSVYIGSVGTTTTRLALRVSGSDVSASVNGTAFASATDANTAAIADIVLELDLPAGSSRAQVDLGNFQITQP